MRMCRTAHGRTPSGDVRDGPAPQRVHRLRRRRVPDMAEAQLAARAVAPAPQPRLLRVCSARSEYGVPSLLKRWADSGVHCTASVIWQASHKLRGPLQPGRRVGLSRNVAPCSAAICEHCAGAPRMQAPGLAAAAPGVRLPSHGDQQRMPRPGAHLPPRTGKEASAPRTRCPVPAMPVSRWQAHAQHSRRHAAAQVSGHTYACYVGPCHARICTGKRRGAGSHGAPRLVRARPLCKPGCAARSRGAHP